MKFRSAVLILPILFMAGCSSIGDVISSPGFWNKKKFAQLTDKTFHLESLMFCWTGPDPSQARPRYRLDNALLAREIVKIAPLAESLAPVGEYYGITFNTEEISAMAALDPPPLVPTHFMHHGVQSSHLSLIAEKAPGFALESRQRHVNSVKIVYFVNEVVFDEEAGKHGLQIITIVSLFSGSEKIQSVEYRLPPYERMRLGLGRRVFFYTPADNSEAMELIKKTVGETPGRIKSALPAK